MNFFSGNFLEAGKPLLWVRGQERLAVRSLLCVEMYMPFLPSDGPCTLGTWDNSKAGRGILFRDKQGQKFHSQQRTGLNSKAQETLTLGLSLSTRAISRYGSCSYSSLSPALGHILHLSCCPDDFPLAPHTLCLSLCLELIADSLTHSPFNTKAK